MNRDKLLCLILIVAFSIRLYIAWIDIPILIENKLSDDAFYYFKIAKNLASGRGVTFDGIHATNGFHPLWLAIITPVYIIFKSNLELPIHIILTISAIIDLATIYLIYQIVDLLTSSRGAALFASIAYGFNSSMLIHSVSGLDTSLGVFLLTLTYYFFLTKRRSERIRDYIILGVMLGLMFLARTDNIFFLIILLGYFFAKKRLDYLFISGLVALLIVSPWFVFNYQTFGTIIQSSGEAYPYVIKHNYVSEYAPQTLDTVKHSAKIFLKGFFMDLIMLNMWGLGFIFVTLYATYLMLARGGDEATRHFTKNLRLLSPILASLLLVCFVHGAIRWYVRTWYLASGAVFAAVFSGLLYDYLSEKDLKTQHNILICLVILTLLLYNIILLPFSYWPWQAEMYEGSEFLNDNLDENAIVGCFNCGIIGYFSDVTVINLDGVVNYAAFEALKDYSLFDFVLENNITHLADHDFSIITDYRDFWGVNISEKIVLVGTVDIEGVTWVDSKWRVYQIQKTL